MPEAVAVAVAVAVTAAVEGSAAAGTAVALAAEAMGQLVAVSMVRSAVAFTDQWVVAFEDR